MKVIIALIGSLIMVISGVYPQERSEENQLQQFADFAEDEQLEITEWSWTAKEPIHQDETEKWAQQASSLFEDEPEVEETINAEKRTWTKQTGDIIETLSLIIPNDSINSAERVYAIDGKGSASLSQKWASRKDLTKSRLFSENVTIFSCIKSVKNGIIDDVLVYEKFKEAFDVVTINVVKDNGWTSMSGHSNEWGQSLPILSEEMNVQFASRTLGGRTNVTIGTPIITAEY
ncbi:YwmB family TATA-box binding protein [Halobacillus salinus]|uniref:YwmB family TATA-box binding protein n=1 Tax=Halobacillus salinus TaxID=192814 RepID=UPI0009A8AE57|nr:YwmB family TATA-box binding protein [Halobacillus salinus]